MAMPFHGDLRCNNGAKKDDHANYFLLHKLLLSSPDLKDLKNLYVLPRCWELTVILEKDEALQQLHLVLA